MDNYRQKLRCFLSLGLLLVALPTGGLAGHPEVPVTFLWGGTGIGTGHATGNGDASDWSNWIPFPSEPGDFFAPLDGDFLDLSFVLVGDAETRRTISLGSLSKDVTYSIVVNADVSGGDLNVESLAIHNLPYDDVFYTTDFTGSNLQADDLSVGSYRMPVTFSGSTLSATTLRMYGGNHLLAYPTAGVGTTNVRNGSALEFTTLEVGKDGYAVGDSVLPYVLNVEGSTLTGFGMDVSGDETSQVTARVQLADGSQATLEQYAVVGSDARGELDLSGASSLTIANGYLNVGDYNPGFMHVAQDSEVRIRDFNVGVFGEGQVAVDSRGAIFNTTAVIGVIPNYQGTVNLEGGGSWRTADLSLGASGTGYVYVRDHGTLRITHEGVLGLQPNSRGVLSLIGPQSKLEISESATLKIGDRGKGELHLSEGAKFTSESDVTLGQVAGGTGIVTVNGVGSHWTVNGTLNVGDASVGRVEIREKGKLTLAQGVVALGTANGGDGTVLVTGDASTLDFSGDLIVGKVAKGNFEVVNGASVKVKGAVIGSQMGSEGILTVSGQGLAPSMFETTTSGAPEEPAFVAGKVGNATISVTDSAKLKTPGFVVLASEQSAVVNANVTGAESQWELADLTVGKSGQATFTINQGKLLASGDIVVGSAGTNESTLTVKGIGGEVKFNEELTVGKEGKGKLVVESGALVESTHALSTLLVASETSASAGTVEVKGQGTKLKSEVFDAGSHGMATVILSDKATIESSILRLGALSDASGDARADVTVSNATWNVRTSLDMRSAGSLTINNGGNVAVNNVLPKTIQLDGRSEGQKGMITVDGPNSTLTTPGTIIVGTTNGYAELSITGGGYVSSNIGAIRNGSPDFPSLVTLSSPNSRWYVGHLYVGDLGQGAVLINTGGRIESEDILLGEGTNTNGTISIDGADSSIFSPRTSVRNGKLTITGGALVLGSQVNVGFDADDSARVSISGANSRLAASSFISCNGGEILSQGIVETRALMIADTVGAYGRLVLDAATAKVTAEQVLLGPGDGLLDAQNGSHVFANIATIQQPGRIIVTFGGSVTLGSSSEVAPLGAVQVNSGGLLRGSGRILGNLIVKKGGTNALTGGVFSPGNSPGVFTVEGNVSIQQGGVLEMEIGGLASGTQYDQVVATGSIAIAGLLDLHIVNSGSGFQLPSIGDEFTLLNAAGGVSGTFENAAQLRSVAGGSLVQWSVTPGANNAVLRATSITALPTGDYNGNGSVDAADYVVWRQLQGGINLAADGNRDGVIDQLDYEVWRGNFGAGSGSGSAGDSNQFEPPTVPEPATWMMLLGAAAVTLTRNWKGASRRDGVRVSSTQN